MRVLHFASACVGHYQLYRTVRKSQRGILRHSSDHKIRAAYTVFETEAVTELVSDDRRTNIGTPAAFESEQYVVGLPVTTINIGKSLTPESAFA